MAHLVTICRFLRCWFEFHHAAAAYVVHTLCRVCALRDAAPAAAMVRPRRLWNGANTHGAGRHKSLAGFHSEKIHRRPFLEFPFKISLTKEI